MTIEQVDLAALKPLSRDFFDRDVETVAKALIGAFLFTVDREGNRTGGRIVETEAYDQDDPAAHCHANADRRRLNRSKSMHLAGGKVYVYSYRNNIPRDPNQQMWCLNFSCDREGFGSAVLVRALEPLCGLELMRERRVEGVKNAGLKGETLKRETYAGHLCNGPAKLCEAINVTIDLDGHSLYELPFEMYSAVNSPSLDCGPRVGVTKAKECQRRYALKDSIYISRRSDSQYPLWPCPNE